MNAVQQLAADTTYLEMQRWVYRLIWEARKQWPLLDPEESVREAYYAYCEAYETYNPKHGSFTNWISIRIRGRLIDLVRKNINQAQKAKKFIEDFDLEIVPIKEEPGFELEEWLSGLSEDAQKVAKLVVFEPPIDIKLLLKQIGERHKLAYRQAIRVFLQESNWSNRRINRTFQEIKRSL